MKKLGATFLLSALVSTFSAHAENIWIEAESGAEYNPIVVKSDLRASDAIYLGSWKWGDYSSRSVDDGVITYRVYVQEAGDYTLWARLTTPWDGIRPYDVSFGSSSVSTASDWYSWAPDERSESERENWGWLESGITQYLNKGMNTFHLIQREGGPELKLDKILLTNEMDFVPQGSGLQESTLEIDNPYVAKTVAKYGQLKVRGSKLTDANGNAVQLQGISAHGLQWFPLVDNQTIPYMAEFFGAEAVRLAMYIEDYAPSDPSDFWGGYVADKSAMLARTEQAIEDAVNAGIYVLVDWHIHNTPSKYTAEAVEFFGHISKKYGHLPNIIYEICNEPVSVSWSGGIKPYAEKLISTIRANDPDNIIIVGTPNWSQDVDAAAQDPLTHSNIMYAFHYYAATHDFNQMKNKVQTALNAGIAIFVSEWGTSDVGTSNSNFQVANQWMDFMNQKGLSWVNWSLGNKDETSSILKPTAPMSGPWDSSDLTESGAWLKPYFDAPEAGSANQNSSSSSSSVAYSSSSVSSSQSSSSSAQQSHSGSIVIEGERFTHVSGTVQSVPNALGYFDIGDVVSYGPYDLSDVDKITFKYGTSYYGGFELRLGSSGGAVIASVSTQPTGGFNSFQERTINLSSKLSGNHKLFLVGKQGYGIMNLDKMELSKTPDTSSNNNTASHSSSSVSNTIPTSGKSCNWYGSILPLCKTVSSGWGWEDGRNCIAATTCKVFQ